ncbi:MAG: 3'-5' exonuclease [Gemmatimonadales bacterium]|nr:3'-5' exonuclease [Gemmatimonadales bacterium]
MKNLRRDRPLAVFDLETTGTDVKNDRIVQLAVIRIEPDGTRTTLETLVNPQCPIPPGATAVHGITDADVSNQPTFAAIAPRVEELLTDADLAGYNSIRFDQPLLEAELQRVGSTLDLQNVRHLDAMTIFHKMERRDLSAAYRFYCGKEMVNAHSALADTAATLEILDAQVGHYEDIPDTTQALHDFCNADRARFVDRERKLAWNDQGEPEFTFGKLQGKTLAVVCEDPDGRGYLEWMLKKDFSEDLKDVLRDALDGVFPIRKK